MSFALRGLALLPPIFLAAAIWSYAVNVPCQDEWQLAPFFGKLSRGTLSFTDLFALQNEYRQFFPNLIIVALGWVTHWDPRVEMALTFSLACFASWGLWQLGRKTLPQVAAQPSLAAAVLLASNLLIFSFTQWENWLMGEQLEYLMPPACLVAGLLTACSRWQARTRVIICMVLCTVATFSTPNGLFCWLLLFPRKSLFHSTDHLRKPWLAGWIVAAVVELIVYLHGYRPNPYHPSPLTAFHQPGIGIVYFLTFLGSPLVPIAPFEPRSLPIAAVAGALLLLTFVLAVVAGFYRADRSDRELQLRLSPWLVVGGYSVLTGGMVMVGRAGFGSAQALSSRYIGFSLYLIVALIWLVLILLDHWAGRVGGADAPSPAKARWSVGVIVVATVALLGLQMTTWRASLAYMAANRKVLLYEKACVSLANHLPSRVITELSSRWGVRDVQQRCNELNQLGLLEPPLVSDGNILSMAVAAQATEGTYGYFDDLKQSPDGAVQVRGWAVLADSDEPAHAVALTYEDHDGHFIIFDVLRVKELRPDLEQSFHSRDLMASGWTGLIRPTDPLPLPTQLDAWAIDAVACKAYRLTGSHRLDSLLKTR